MLDFLENQKWKNNPALSIGDIAIIKFEDGFIYSAYCIVERIMNDKIIGYVDAVFDAFSDDQVLFDPIMHTEQWFTLKHIFKVIKKNPT